MKSEAVSEPSSIASDLIFSMGLIATKNSQIKYISTRSSITMTIDASLFVIVQLYLPIEIVWLVQLAYTKYYQFAAVV